VHLITVATHYRRRCNDATDAECTPGDRLWKTSYHVRGGSIPWQV